MAKDKDNNKDHKHKKKKNRHDNTSDENKDDMKNDIDKEDLEEGQKPGDSKEKDSDDDGVAKDEKKDSEEQKGKSKIDPEKGKMPLTEEEIKKKKEETLKKKIELAKQFDTFKHDVYKQTGLSEIDFLDELQKLEEEAVTKPEATLGRVRVFLQEVNQIRQELARLDTNLAGAVYYENEVFPVLNSLFFLAGMAGDLSLVARNLIQVSLAKNSKIEDSIALTYRMVRLTDRLFNLLEIKIYKLIRILSVNE